MSISASGLPEVHEAVVNDGVRGILDLNGKAGGDVVGGRFDGGREDAGCGSSREGSGKEKDRPK